MRPITISVGASRFSEVGKRNSDFGALELIWKPGVMRKRNSTEPGLPGLMLSSGAGAMLTDGALAAPIIWPDAATAASTIKLPSFRSCHIACESIVLRHGKGTVNRRFPPRYF